MSDTAAPKSPGFPFELHGIGTSMVRTFELKSLHEAPADVVTCSCGWSTHASDVGALRFHYQQCTRARE